MSDAFLKHLLRRFIFHFRVGGNWRGVLIGDQSRLRGLLAASPRSFRKTRQCLRALFLPSLHRSNSLHAEITRKEGVRFRSIGAVKFVEKTGLQPALLLEEHRIFHTIVVFASTRICEPEAARRRVDILKSALTVTQRRIVSCER